MTILQRALLLLYPRHWRERYGRELQALLEESASRGRFDGFDLIKGALFMRIHAMAGAPVWRTLALFVLAGAVAGGVAARWFVPLKYASSARITFSGDRAMFGDFDVKLKTALGRPSLTALIQEFDLYEQERTEMPLEEVVERMRKHLTISRAGAAPNPVVVEFVYSDAGTAHRVVREFVRKLLSPSGRSVQAEAPTLTVSVAQLPAVRIAPDASRAMAAGAIAGLILGLTLCWGVRGGFTGPRLEHA